MPPTVSRRPPKSKMATAPKDPFRGFAEAIEAVRQDAMAKGLDKLTMREINKIVADVRRDMKRERLAAKSRGE